MDCQAAVGRAGHMDAILTAILIDVLTLLSKGSRTPTRISLHEVD
jgi:hypothetical protein